MDHFCPWTGYRNCGCTSARLVDGMLPAECEKHLSIAYAEVHVQARRTSPELTAEVKRWVAAGRPRLDHWVGEDDEDGGDNRG